MSTKSRLKEQASSDDMPGYSLYYDCLDTLGDAHTDTYDAPVYLEFENIEFSTEVLKNGTSRVTICIPREIAGALSLVPLTGSLDDIK